MLALYSTAVSKTCHVDTSVTNTLVGDENLFFLFLLPIYTAYIFNEFSLTRKTELFLATRFFGSQR